MAAWFLADTKWPIEDLSADNPLKVYFMNHCPEKWKYKSDIITPECVEKLLVEVLNHRSFVFGSEEESAIRVKFEGVYTVTLLLVCMQPGNTLFYLHADCSDNWSAIGSLAKTVPKERPTMVLNFSGMNDKEIKATIAHQFGHALGLGHVLIKPEDWNDIKPYLNIEEMMKSLGIQKEEDLDVELTG